MAGFAAAAVGLVAFLVWERRAAFPMLELRFFAVPGFSVGTATIALAFFAMFGMFFLLTQYLQSVRGYSPLEAGLRTLPMMAAMVPSASASARWAECFGTRAVLRVGLTLVGVGLATLASLDTASPAWVLAAGLVVLGVGIGNVSAPATGAVMTSLPVAKAGVGSAVNDTAREVGGALGIAVLGSIVASCYRAGLDLPAGLSQPAAEAAHRSVGAAIESAAELDAAGGGALVTAARAAYTDAMSAALVVAAGVAFAAAAIVGRFLPRHQPDSNDQPPRPAAAGATITQEG